MLNIVFPIGGRGERFIEKRYRTPKPFIKIGGVSLIKIVSDCYPEDSLNKKHFIVREEYVHEMLFGCYSITQETRGPLETIVSSKDLIKQIATKDELLIADCDSIIGRNELTNALNFFRNSLADGGVTTRYSKDSACSYAQIDKDGQVIRTAEKQVISNYSTTGPYWFKTGIEFMKVAHEGMKEGEFHISPLYNFMIRNKRKVVAFQSLLLSI